MSDDAGQPAAAVTGIVLAGGRSSRYGSDKLVATIDGQPLLQRAIEAVAAVAAEVIVVLAPADDRSLPDSPVPLRRVVDDQPFAGPLVGLRAGLEAAREPTVVVVGGDMPTIRPSVLSALVRALLAAGDTIGATVVRSRGLLIPLPAALKTGIASDRVGVMVEDGERSLRALFERLPTRVLEEADWRPLDPDGETIRDVDRPSDL